MTKEVKEAKAQHEKFKKEKPHLYDSNRNYMLKQFESAFNSKRGFMSNVSNVQVM